MSSLTQLWQFRLLPAQLVPPATVKACRCSTLQRLCYHILFNAPSSLFDSSGGCSSCTASPLGTAQVWPPSELIHNPPFHHTVGFERTTFFFFLDDDRSVDAPEGFANERTTSFSTNIAGMPTRIWRCDTQKVVMFKQLKKRWVLRVVATAPSPFSQHSRGRSRSQLDDLDGHEKVTGSTHIISRICYHCVKKITNFYISAIFVGWLGLSRKYQKLAARLNMF